MLNLFLTLALSAPINQVCTFLGKDSTLLIKGNEMSFFMHSNQAPGLSKFKAHECQREGDKLTCHTTDGVRSFVTEFSRGTWEDPNEFKLRQAITETYPKQRTYGGNMALRFTCKEVDAETLETARIQAHLDLTRAELEFQGNVADLRKRMEALDKIKAVSYADPRMTQDEVNQLSKDIYEKMKALGY